MRNTKIPHSGSKLACVVGRKREAGGQGEKEGEGGGEKREWDKSPSLFPYLPPIPYPFQRPLRGLFQVVILTLHVKW